METKHQPTRRKFLFDLGLTGLSLPLFSSMAACQETGPSSTSTSAQPKEKLGVALVGLGNYATHQLATALEQTQHCYLAGIVTGTPSKIPVWKKKYNIPDKNIYNYENYDSIKDNPDIDVIYVVLPNSMHAEYSIRAAKAGKHVICEKPMALTVEECDQMIEACKKADRFLGIGYRLHYEPYNLEMVRLGREKVYGDIEKLNAGFAFIIGDPTQWRLNKKLAGGGPLQDLGIYCIQGICYTSGMEPIAVTAKEGPKTNLTKFKEVEESISWQFEMPGGLIAEGKSSYNDQYNFLRADAAKGQFELSPAYNYGGLKGKTPDGEMKFKAGHQQASQLDAMALAIKNNERSITPGEMGKRDVRYISAIYESARTGNRISLL